MKPTTPAPPKPVGIAGVLPGRVPSASRRVGPQGVIKLPRDLARKKALNVLRGKEIDVTRRTVNGDYVASTSSTVGFSTYRNADEALEGMIVSTFCEDCNLPKPGIFRNQREWGEIEEQTFVEWYQRDYLLFPYKELVTRRWCCCASTMNDLLAKYCAMAHIDQLDHCDGWCLANDVFCKEYYCCVVDPSFDD